MNAQSLKVQDHFRISLHGDLDNFSINTDQDLNMDTHQQDNDFEYDEADENKIQVIIEKAQPQQTQVKPKKDFEYYFLLKFLRNPIKVCLVIL